MATDLRRTIPRSPVSAEEVAATRRHLLQAETLPPRVYHDQEVFDWEIEAWFRQEWLFVGREEDLPETGSFFRVDAFGENIVVVRGNDGVIRAFYNVCRHRGSTIIEEDAGRIVRFQCPYHAWIYDLTGKLRPPMHTDTLENFSCEAFSLIPVHVGTWAGHIFISLAEEPMPFEEHLGDFRSHFDRFNLHELRRTDRIVYDTRANWKGIVENYEECYHCPGVHPLLNHITPVTLPGGSLRGDGQWACGWMILDDQFETMSMDGYLHGRKVLPTMTPDDLRRIYYAVVWPNLLFSLHPDFLMLHYLWPLAPDRTTIVCELYFHPDAMAEPDFDSSGPREFWDLTNRQDWHVCELQQRGTASRSYTPGRYANNEGGVHWFDLQVADRYAGDGVKSNFPRVRRETSDPIAAAKERGRAALAAREAAAGGT
ncbi:MAG: (2Fe-2S)-binding protein [Chloroflexi bacterium]|nr:MAG: (2Fe-2S)-binding protein [Chloroflexota bacterium]